MAAPISVPVAVIGGGPAGYCAALALRSVGCEAVVADTSKAASNNAALGRSAALLNSTVAFLREIGVWEACSPYAAALRALYFIDDTGRRLRAPDCVFHASEIGEDAFGYNIANADLVAALKAEAARRGIKTLEPGPLSRLVEVGDRSLVTFADGTEVSASLVVAADGRVSATREAAGLRAYSWSYDQAAVATSFEHERDHNGLCIEVHRSAGPFTLVPLPGRRSSLVWVERRAEAERLSALDDPSFAAEVEKISRRALGGIAALKTRGHFPLSSLAARDYGQRRVALVGESAHVTPPIGAQGLNLGFRDVQSLADLVREAASQGEDIGGTALLRAYSTARRGDIISRTAGVDLLNRTLLSGLIPFQAARGLGLYTLSNVGPLRRAFMRRGIAPARGAV